MFVDSRDRATPNDGPSAECILVRARNLILLIFCAPVVCRISGSGIRKAVLRSVWIVNDKGRYHSELLLRQESMATNDLSG